ncbi:FAD-dependent oxidoreductase [Luteolibacter ambystomatis]|uniref:FAD-dependent oxidoreductase n=1 Tax=Luteolibacter ambystomatis TaxID=2824561 RepID=A0A975G6N9_9BACT|nr:FAD-dependent oxidoreductase [Luteolibacter ambystomatis]QUE50322.1 FAD-dependent oxidoreductase [Luteolibacter ambystomatis]
MKQSWDHIIVGGGILGASFASALLAQGKRVALFERFSRPNGGSVRNFGLAWPFIAPDLASIPLGLRTAEIYRTLSDEFHFGWNPCGSLLVAETAVEAAVLADFETKAGDYGLNCRMLEPRDAIRHHPRLLKDGMQGALAFPDAAALEPRIFVACWLEWLRDRKGLGYFPSTTVVRIEEGCTVHTASGDRFQAPHVLVCAGEEFQTLFPETFIRSGIRRCKLSMLQTEPLGLPRGIPGLAFGRSLRHYPVFSGSPAFANMLAEPSDAASDRLGIHLLVKPAPDGSLVIGDSHEYTAPDEPPDFDQTAEVEQLLFRLAHRHLRGCPFLVSKRWLGYYAKHPEKPWIEEHPLPGVTVLCGLTIGMSVGPAFAEQQVAGWRQLSKM